MKDSFGIAILIVSCALTPSAQAAVTLTKPQIEALVLAAQKVNSDLEQLYKSTGVPLEPNLPNGPIQPGPLTPGNQNEIDEVATWNDDESAFAVLMMNDGLAGNFGPVFNNESIISISISNVWATMVGPQYNPTPLRFSIVPIANGYTNLAQAIAAESPAAGEALAPILYARFQYLQNWMAVTKY